MSYTPTHPVHLPLTDFQNLEFHLLATRPGVSPDTFAAELIQRWLKIEIERLSLRADGPSMRGFQWKNVFLPDGTNLRTSYLQQIEFAKVIVDRILSDGGESLTPSSFANRHTTGRNAWRLIWLRFPGDAHWVRAIDCRGRSNREGLDRSKT